MFRHACASALAGIVSKPATQRPVASVGPPGDPLSAAKFNHEIHRPLAPAITVTPGCIAYRPSGQPQGADLLLSGKSLAGLARRLIAAPASPSLKSAYRYGLPRAPVTKPHREPSLVTSPRAFGPITARCCRARSPASRTTSGPHRPPEASGGAASLDADDKSLGSGAFKLAKASKCGSPSGWLSRCRAGRK